MLLDVVYNTAMFIKLEFFNVFIFAAVLFRCFSEMDFALFGFEMHSCFLCWKPLWAEIFFVAVVEKWHANKRKECIITSREPNHPPQ